LDQTRASVAEQRGNEEDLQKEIEALNRHMDLLQQQNAELSVELEKFIEADEQVRRNLNRRGKVEEIRSKVDEAILKSMREVETRRSPDRFFRGENGRHV